MESNQADIELGKFISSNQQEPVSQGMGIDQEADSELGSWVKEEQFGTLPQQLITAAEGAASAATFGLSTAAEIGLGVEPEKIEARREVNPLSHTAGQLTGLVGSTFIPGGAGAVATRAGEVAATALGIGEATALAKMGSQAAKMAVENALITSGDEVSKMFTTQRPIGEAAQTAITDIGLSGLIGAGTGAVFGAVSPLWSATVGRKTEALLDKIKNRVEGYSVPVAPDMEALLKNVPPEIRAGFSEDPALRQKFFELVESGTPSGDAVRQVLGEFKDDVGTKLQTVFSTAEGKSAHEAGNAAKESILRKADEIHNAARAKYDQIADATGIALPDDARLKFYDSLIEQGQNFGAKGSPASELFKTYGERALAQDTVGQLDKLVTEINSAKSVAYRAGDFEKSKALGDITESIREFQENQISNQAKLLAKETGDSAIIDAADQLKNQRAEARRTWAEFRDSLGDIASLGKLGKVNSFSQLQDALESVPSAKLAAKLFDKKNIEGLEYLKKNFPDVLDTLINSKKSEILENALKTGELQHNKILNQVNSLPIEVKNLMFKPEELEVINSAGKLLREGNFRINPSGTARTLDKLWNHAPAGLGGMIGLLTGKSTIAGMLMGEATQILGRNVPDAIKLSMLKFLGSSGPIESSAFKSMLDFMQATAKGEAVLNKAASSLFTKGEVVFAGKMLPDSSSREKLEKRLETLKKKPSELINIGGGAGSFIPEQAAGMSETAARVVTYLNNNKPQNPKQSPLDPELPLSPMQQSEWNRKLDLAQQPLILINDIKDGTITSSDVNALIAMYPDLYTRMQEKIIDNLTTSMNGDESIPYNTRMGLSLFLGQALDSTMSQTSIASIQGQNSVALQAQQGQTVPVKGRTLSELDKTAGAMMTPEQSRELQKIKPS